MSIARRTSALVWPQRVAPGANATSSHGAGVKELEREAKDAAKIGNTRSATIQRYLAQQKAFLQARAGQLKRRISQMEAS